MAGTTSWKKPSLEILHWLRPGKQTRLETLFSGKVRRNAGLNHAENKFIKKSRQIYQFHLAKGWAPFCFRAWMCALKPACVSTTVCRSGDMCWHWLVDSLWNSPLPNAPQTLCLFTHNHQHVSEHSLDLSTSTVQMPSTSGRSFPPNC